MIRRKVAFVVAVVVAFSMLATSDDVTFAATRQVQQDGGFFGRLFGPSSPPDQQYIRRRPPPGIRNTEKPDLVVVLLGANDRQPMRQGNQRVPVGSDTWEKTYTHRVEGLVDTVKVYGRPFFWMSAPPMRAGTSGAGDVTYLN